MSTPQLVVSIMLRSISNLMMRVARAQLIETLSIFVQLLAVILANSTDFCFIYSLPWLLNFFRILKLIRSSLCYLTPSFFI
jgi:hypothetical protein